MFYPPRRRARGDRGGAEVRAKTGRNWERGRGRRGMDGWVDRWLTGGQDCIRGPDEGRLLSRAAGLRLRMPRRRRLPK